MVLSVCVFFLIIRVISVFIKFLSGRFYPDCKKTVRKGEHLWILGLIKKMHISQKLKRGLSSLCVLVTVLDLPAFFWP